ncbi:hypothetical protein [Streptomyces spinosirectus]
MTTDPQSDLRDRIAAAMRPHYHCTGDTEQDVIPCACGWLDPGPDATHETDWDAHIADVVLPVLPPRADRAAVLREAADFAEQLMDERYGPDCSYGIGGLDVARELRRLAAEAQADDGYRLDEEYAIDVDEDGRPFARVLFAFQSSVPGEKRIALVHGITGAVDGARFGAEAAEAQQDGAQS